MNKLAYPPLLSHLAARCRRLLPLLLLQQQQQQQQQNYYTRLTAFFPRTTWVSRYQKGNTSLDLNEARDDGVCDGSGISWTICKQSAPRSRQTTTPTPHHSVVYRPDALPNAQNNSVKALKANVAFAIVY